MAHLTRLRNWLSAGWRKSGRLGKAAILLVPLMFGCCALTMFSALLSPPDAEPTAELAERAAATAESSEPTAAPATDEATLAPTATDVPSATPRPTTRPTNTARPTTAPTTTDEPTRPPVRAATSLAATVIADQLTVTAAPPTATVVRAATVALPTATLPAPTSAPLPTATQPPPVAAPGDVAISSVRYNGDINPQEPDEYAVITNRGGAVVNLGGWRLNAGEPDQNFGFPSFDLGPGQSCRVYTNQVNADSCGGGTFGSGQAIWNNGGDCGILYNAEGAEASRYCW